MIRSTSSVLIYSQRVRSRRTRWTPPMEQTTQATATAGAAGSGNPHPTTPSGPPSPIDNLVGSVPDEQPAKAPDWMKLQPKGTPKEELKPPKLSKNETYFPTIRVTTHRITMDNAPEHKVHARPLRENLQKVRDPLLPQTGALV